MTAAAKALDAVDAAIKATFPRPGDWRWNVRPGNHRVDFGTHNWEAMTFGRWGMNGAQPRFLTRTDVPILRDAADFLKPVPGREHHEWEKRIEHPVAQTIELGVNLLGPLAAVARAAMKVRETWSAGWDCSNDVGHRDHCFAIDDLVEAIESLEAAARAQGFQP